MISSTARIMDINESKPIPSHTFLFLRNRLSELEHDYKKLTEISDNFASWHALDEKQQIENERKKIFIIQSVNELIDEVYGQFKQKITMVESEGQKSGWGYKVLLFLWVIVDLALALTGGFMGFMELLALLVPGIASLTVTLVSSFFYGC